MMRFRENYLQSGMPGGEDNMAARPPVAAKALPPAKGSESEGTIKETAGINDKTRCL